MEKYLQAVWNDILGDIKDSIEDPESRQALKNIIEKTLIKNKNKHPSMGGASGGSETKNVGSTTVVSKGTTVTGYNLHWADWKTEHTQKEYADPEDEEKKISAHKYWQKYVWPNLKKGVKDEYNKKGQNAREKAKKADPKEGTRKVSKSGYQLFLEKMKELVDKDQEFTHPDSGETIKLHHYLIYVWNNHIKTSNELKEPFETMANNMRENEEDTYDLSELPHLDVEKLLAGDLDNLELIS